MRAGGVGEAGEGHFFAGGQRGEERFELRGVGMIRNVPRIQHLHGEFAPLVFVRLEFLRVEFVVEQAAFAADEVGVEIIRLETVHDGGAFADAAVLELQERHAAGVVFVGRKDFAPGLGVVARDFGDVVAHAEQEGVEGVATGGEQGAAAGVFAGVPAELPIPRADAVIIIHFAVVQRAEQALIQHGFGGEKLTGVTALEADAGFDLGLLDGGFHFAQVFERHAKRFLDDDVFAGPRGFNHLGFVLIRVAANGDGINVRIGEHFIEVVVSGDVPAMFGAEFAGIQLARGIDGGDLGEGRGVDGGNVRGGDPAVTDDADVIFFHEKGKGFVSAVCHKERRRLSKQKRV